MNYLTAEEAAKLAVPEDLPENKYSLSDEDYKHFNRILESVRLYAKRRYIWLGEAEAGDVSAYVLAALLDLGYEIRVEINRNGLEFSMDYKLTW